MEKPPKCMLSGPRYVAPPHMKGQAKRNAKIMNAPKTDEKEDKLRVCFNLCFEFPNLQEKRKRRFERLDQKLKEMGIVYDLSSIPSL